MFRSKSILYERPNAGVDTGRYLQQELERVYRGWEGVSTWRDASQRRVALVSGGVLSLVIIVLSCLRRVLGEGKPTRGCLPL